MTLQNFRIFLLSAICTASALIALIIFSHVCFALEANDDPLQTVDPVSSDTSSDVREESEPAPPTGPGELSSEAPEIDFPISGSSEPQENEPDASPSEDVGIEDESVPEDTFGQEEPVENLYGSEFLDSGPVDEAQQVPTLEQNVYALRRYIELVLFILLPISIAVFVIVFFCAWFYKTFISWF